MRITIDVTAAAQATPTGVASYVLGLVEQLAHIDGETSFCLYHRITRNRSGAYLPPPPGPNFRYRLGGGPLDWLACRRSDVFHGTEVRLPRCSGPVFVSTVHDVWFLISDEFSKRSLKKKTNRYRDAIARAARIITPSEYTRQDLIERLNADPQKIVPIHLGVRADLAPASAESIARAREKYHLPERYILYLGPVCARKNTAALARAYALVRKRFESDTKFVIAGDTRQPDALLKVISEEHLEDHVRLLGWVHESELASLYTAARAFAFPSLYEGFGLPVLEAMACGVPVVTSNVSSLPEVAGDAALLVNPRDIKELGEALLLAADHAETRERLIRLGAERVQKQFSWTETARRTHAVYAEAAATKANY